jgi:hypothetical protein
LGPEGVTDVDGDTPVRLLTDTWIGGWTLMLAAGLIAEMTPWPALRAFRAPGVYGKMLMASSAVVLFLILIGLSRAATEITIWAILACVIKHLVDLYHPEL